MRMCVGTTKIGSRCGSRATHRLPGEPKTTRCFHHQKQPLSYDERNVATSSRSREMLKALSSKPASSDQISCPPMNTTPSAVTSFLKKSNKGTVDANTAATPRKDAQDPSSSTPSRQRNTPSKKIPEFETLDPDFIGEQSAVKVAKRKAPPHADEDRFKKGGSLGSQTGPSTINKKPNTGDAELDAGISELVQGLKNTKPSKQQATKQLYALAQHDLTSHQQRLKGPQSSPATRRSPVKAPHSEESSVNPREVLAQLGRVLRPYIFTPDKSLLLADSNTYANFSIDDEISNTLDNLAGSFTAEAFLANAKILKKVVRHHTSVLKEQGSVVSRHGKRIAITEGQIDMLTARVDLLEQQQKEGGTKKQGIVFD